MSTSAPRRAIFAPSQGTVFEWILGIRWGLILLFVFFAVGMMVCAGSGKPTWLPALILGGFMGLSGFVFGSMRGARFPWPLGILSLVALFGIPATLAFTAISDAIRAEAGLPMALFAFWSTFVLALIRGCEYWIHRSDLDTVQERRMLALTLVFGLAGAVGIPLAGVSNVRQPTMQTAQLLCGDPARPLLGGSILVEVDDRRPTTYAAPEGTVDFGLPLYFRVVYVTPEYRGNRPDVVDGYGRDRLEVFLQVVWQVLTFGVGNPNFTSSPFIYRLGWDCQ